MQKLGLGRWLGGLECLYVELLSWIPQNVGGNSCLYFTVSYKSLTAVSQLPSCCCEETPWPVHFIKVSICFAYSGVCLQFQGTGPDHHALREEGEGETDRHRESQGEGGLPWTLETRSHLLILNRSPPGKQTLKYVSPWVPFSFKPPQIVSLHFKTETGVRKARLPGVVVCLYSQPQNSQETEAGGSGSWDKPGLHCQTLAQKKKKSNRKVRISICLIEECVFFLYHLRVSILIDILILIKNTSTAVIIYWVYVLCPTVALWYVL